MTTGRINQVTILHPRTARLRGAQKPLPESGRTCYRRGDPKMHPTEAPSAQDAERELAAIQLPPPSFPGGGPQRGARALKPPHFAAYAPRVGETLPRHAQGRILVGACPQRPRRRYSHWLTVHRPQEKGLLARASRASTPHRRSRRQTEGNRLCSGELTGHGGLRLLGKQSQLVWYREAANQRQGAEIKEAQSATDQHQGMEIKAACQRYSSRESVLQWTLWRVVR